MTPASRSVAASTAGSRANPEGTRHTLYKIRCTNKISGETMSSVMELTLTELDRPTRDLYELAREAAACAYAPYSKFQVGAAIRTAKGTLFRGCNVENASYGLTCCAERSAIFAAVAAEGSEMRILEVAVYVSTAMASPCGACRQVIAEFGSDVRVLFSDGDRIIDTSITELLPSHFVPPA